MSDTYENYATNFELKEEEHWEDSLVSLIRDAGISRDHSAQARAVHVATNDHTIADDEQQLALVVVLHLRERVDRLLERGVALRVTWHLTDDELVVVLWCSSRGEGDGGERREG